jgi:hypothetical protein
MVKDPERMRERIRRGDVYRVNLDPALGPEIKKTRPALIVSPDDMNAALPRVIVAPSPRKASHSDAGRGSCSTADLRASYSTRFVSWTNADLPENLGRSTLRSGMGS